MSYNIHIIERLEKELSDIRKAAGLTNHPERSTTDEVADLYEEVGVLRAALMAEQERANQLQETVSRQGMEITERLMKRCGTCADWEADTEGALLEGNRWCENGNSLCRGSGWPADHGCPHWRQK